MNIDSLSISIASYNYIKGIYWTYNYYKRFDLDYEWYYPYNYPPTVKDISNYLKVNIIQPIKLKGVFLEPKIQLLSNKNTNKITKKKCKKNSNNKPIIINKLTSKKKYIYKHDNKRKYDITITKPTIFIKGKD